MTVRRTEAARLVFRGVAIGFGGAAAVLMTLALARAFNAQAGLNIAEGALLLLFLICAFWISFSFVLALAGFLVTACRGNIGGAAPAGSGPIQGRTAVVMTVYNEDPEGCAANLLATINSVRAAGALDAFDFFLLSDSTRPEVARREAAVWHALCRDYGLGGKLFYRHREDNVAAKAGNVADFCRRWGGAYDYMVVLDADSLMEGETLVALARRMDANPDAGLIQTQTQCAGRSTLFARIMQFSNHLYGPVFAAGQALWQGRDGNYWGHNAIIRVAAFASCCGLPRLSGAPPLGGHILSHDFVEAALLRRGGWEVWLAPELGGSYEECPPTLLDYIKRDQRWCQGNLQHMRVLGAHGLHPVSRFHLINGIMSFLCSPLWMAFLLVGLGLALADAVLGHDYFGTARSLFPGWPVFDAERAAALFLVALGLLLLPRLSAVLLVLASPARRRSFGGGPALIASAMLELIYSALVAPVLMVFHSLFVANTLLGRSIKWESQIREDRALPWAVLARHFGPMVAAGLVVAWAAYLASAPLLLWLLPIIAGLVLAPVLCRVTSLASAGLGARRLGLFLIPEEVCPSPVLTAARAALGDLSGRPAQPALDDAVATLAMKPAAG